MQKHGMNDNSRPRLLRDIQAQPESLAGVLSYHCGEGREALEQAAALLRGQKRVIITGMGASLYASLPLEYLLCGSGIDASAVESAEMLHYHKDACDGAVAVLVSRSGESVEVAKLSAALRGRVPMIGVTNEADSPLARDSNSSLHIRSLPDEMVAIQSYTGTVLTLLLLGAAASGTLAEMRAALEKALESLPELIARNLAALESWDEFLEARTPVYLLGRGPSCGSALEGALLFNETAKAPAAGMPAGSFRHGPVELVDERFCGIVFAAAGRTRTLNLTLARDVQRFGGKVRVIGPQDGDSAGLTVCEVPAAAEPVAPLLEIIPVQFAALRLAQLRGLKIGSFRYTPQVTRDENAFVR
jgi:glutamine---fructose-6-phosphate transaminase (isomerizing)